MKRLENMKKVKYLIYPDKDIIDRLPNTITIDIETMIDVYKLDYIEDMIYKKYGRNYTLEINHAGRTVSLKSKWT